MIYYDYDANGWLIGWHEGEARPNSTPLDYRPIPPRRARFFNGAWTDDPGQEQADAAAVQSAEADRTARERAVQFLRSLDFDNATAAQTKTACKALWALIKAMHREDS